MNEILKIENLRIGFYENDKLNYVVRGVNFKLNNGEILGVLGESGSGKSISVMSIIGLNRYLDNIKESGKIFFKDNNLMELNEKEIRRIRGKEISYCFQNPVSSLNPNRKIGRQIKEALEAHSMSVSKKEVVNVLNEVGLDDAELICNKYPFQISGGQAQRIIIAMSVIAKPHILIADEPTSSIDASMRKKILNLFKKLNVDYGMSLMIITHDFDVAKFLCDRVIIMYAGLIMEEGSIKDILDKPMHPYTMELLKCVNSLDENSKRLYTMKGSVLGSSNFRNECPFYDRCSIRKNECLSNIPELKEFENDRKVRCINL